MSIRGTGHVYLRGKIWWLKYYVNGEVRYESAETENKTAAIKLLKQRLGKPKGTATSERLTVQDLITAMLAHHKQHRPKSYESYAVPVAKHLSAGLGAIRATKVSQGILNGYIKDRQEEGASNATINREMEVLRRAYNLAREDRKIDRDSIPSFHHLEESLPRQGFLEPEQYRKLFDALQEDSRPALVVGYHTGLRKAKVLGLRLDQFDLTERVLRMDPENNAVKKVPAVLPLYGDLLEFAERHIRATRATLPNCPWFCHRSDGSHIAELRPAWDDAATAAGLPGLLFHDLRRSAVRNMERAGVPRTIAMKMSGHKTESVYRRYDIVSMKDVEAAGEKLEAFLGGGK